MQKVIIIGAGPAGCAAAVQCQRLGHDVLMFDKTGEAGGLITNAFCIENYPGTEKPLDGLQFAKRLQEHLARFGISVTQATVQKVKRNKDGYFTVTTQDETYVADAVVVATGTNSKQLQLPGIDTLRQKNLLFHEVKDLLKMRNPPGFVVIPGGGEASFDFSLSLARIGTKVQILCRSRELKVRGRLLELVKSEPHIQVALETGIENISGFGDGVKICVSHGESTQKNQVIQCDALLVAIGRVPAGKQILEDFELTGADSTLTPAPGLFICGDARLGTLGQAGIAIGDGLAAAMKI